MKKAGTKNPVFMLDEVDKMASDFRGDPASALLEVLDPEQNTTLPGSLPRRRIRPVAGAVRRHRQRAAHHSRRRCRTAWKSCGCTATPKLEKLEIAKQYLVKKQREGTGLTEKNIDFTDDAIRTIIRGYTREAGVRNLEREIGNVCRKVARRVVKNGAKHKEDDHRPQTSPNSSACRSSATRWCTRRAKSAWSPAWPGPRSAAAFSTTEVQVLDGKGKLTLTGQLGDVMQESAQAALSYIRSRAQHLGLPRDFYRNLDIHVHVPEGAIPKDGPSAGITLATALASALTKIPVRRDIAMTGEITLRGKVLPDRRPEGKAAGGAPRRHLRSDPAATKTRRTSPSCPRRSRT